MATCINCNFNDPCFCVGTSVIPTVPTCPTGVECCLIACGTTVAHIDAVGPCGAVGTTDLSVLNHNVSGCKAGTIQYILESWDTDFFVSVSLTDAGLLTWETSDETTVNKYSVIKFRIQCTSKDTCGASFTLSSVADANIGVRNLCLGVNCTVDGEVCNPCNGLCESEIPDVEIV